MRDHVLGLDHIVLAVGDLAGAAEQWRALGFTVSTRGLHSDYLGTANHTIMFEDDYVELLGVLIPTQFNAPTRDFLAGGAGLERLAMRTDDARGGLEGLARDGIAGTGPFEFRRPVTLDDGRSGEAGFRIFQWPLEPAPGGARLFACQHLTREATWLPSLVSHRNGTRALLAVEIVAADPRREAELCGNLLDLPVEALADGAWLVRMQPRGADLVFADAAAFARRWGRNSDARGCGLVLAVDDTETAAPFARWASGDGKACASVAGAFIGWQRGAAARS